MIRTHKGLVATLSASQLSNINMLAYISKLTTHQVDSLLAESNSGLAITSQCIKPTWAGERNEMPRSKFKHMCHLS